MRVYPSPGLVVRDPVLRDALPAEGREVSDDDLYWVRRLESGDATLTAPAPAAAVALDHSTTDAEASAQVEGSTDTQADGSDNL